MRYVPRGDHAQRWSDLNQQRLVDESDKSGKIIVAIVVFSGLVAIAPQFKLFQNVTGITSWIEFLRNMFAV